MENQPTNPVKAIRAKCLECSCGSFAEVEQCPVTVCPLFPFRFGKNPFRQKIERTPEHIAKLRDGARIARERKNTYSNG